MEEVTPVGDFCKDTSEDAETLTVLGYAVEDGERVPVGLHPYQRARHLHVIGQAGGGKSTLLESVVLQDIAAGRGGLFLDPHGDSAARVREAVGERDGVSYLSLTAGTLPLRLLSVGDVGIWESRQTGADLALDVVRNAVRGLDERSLRVIHKALQALSWVPSLPGTARGTAEASDVVAFLRDAEYREWVLGHVSDEDDGTALREWWAVAWGELDRAQAADETDLVEKALTPLRQDPALRAAGMADWACPLREAMDRGDYIVVSLDSPDTSALARSVAGHALVAEVALAALTRQGSAPGPYIHESERRRFHVVLDEFPSYLPDGFAVILEEARKFGLGLTFAHQTMGQMEGLPMLRKSMESCVANRIAMGVGPVDARYLEPFFAPLVAQDLVSLPSYHAAARFMNGFQYGSEARVIATYAPGETPGISL